MRRPSALRAATQDILAANAKDIEAARAAGRPAAFIDRLLLNEARIEAMAKGVEEIAELADPVGTVLAEWTRPNGLAVRARARADRRHRHHLREPAERDGRRRRARASSPATRRSCAAARRASTRRWPFTPRSSPGLKSAGLPDAAIQLVPTPDRAAVGQMLAGLDGAIDVIVPRGGKSLVERVQKEARVPVFAHLEGICHTYVDRDADLDMAVSIVLNAKMRRTGVCGATETLLVDAGAPASCPADAGQGAARRGLRGARRRGRAEGRSARRSRRPRPTGRPSISTRSSR